MPEPLVYLRGRMVPASQASLPLYDAGFVLGAAVTELTRTFHHRLFRLEEHLARLFGSLRRVRIEIGLSPGQLAAVSEELAAHNAGLLSKEEDLGLVHIVTPGPYPTYAGMAGPISESGPTLCLHTFPLPFGLWAGRMQRGVRLVTPATRHVPAQCVDPAIKQRSRMHYYLADLQARDSDPSAWALLLDLDGRVTETAGANFMMVAGGVLVTPTARTTLPGISRQTVMELAAGLSLPCVERDFGLDEAMNADEAMLTSTPYCVMPVSHINGAPLRAGAPGPTTRRLQEAWSRMAGLDVVEQVIAGAPRP